MCIERASVFLTVSYNDANANTTGRQSVPSDCNACQTPWRMPPQDWVEGTPGRDPICVDPLSAQIPPPATLRARVDVFQRKVLGSLRSGLSDPLAAR